MITVKVDNDNPMKAIQKLKQIMMKENTFVELKRKQFHVKPSEAKRLKRKEAERQRNKDEIKLIKMLERNADAIFPEEFKTN